MSLRDLSLGEMAALTAPWVGEQRAAFRAVPEIAGLYPAVERAHESVLAARRHAPTPAVDPAIARDEAALDRRHDLLVRGAWHLVEGAAMVLRAMDHARPDEADALIAARDALIPDGLVASQRTYLEEAGNAARAQRGLDAATRRVLAHQPAVHGATLADVVEQWMHVAKKLGALEHRKARATATTDGDAPDAPGATLHAHSQWIRAVNAVLHAMELATAPAAQLDALRSGVQAAAARHASTTSPVASPPEATAPGAAAAPTAPSTTATR